MTYSQKANPNATNSEMDSKTIIKQIDNGIAPELTSQQWDELIEQYVDLCVDSMDFRSMEEFVRQTLTQDFEEIQSRHELCEEIRLSFDEETLNDLLDNVTNPTVLDTNQTGGKF